MKSTALQNVTYIAVLMKTSKKTADGVLYPDGLVRCVRPEEFNSKEKIVKALGNKSWQRFAGFRMLQQALESDDAKGMFKGAALLINNTSHPRGMENMDDLDASDIESTFSELGCVYLPNFINAQLEHARLVFYWDLKQQRMLPGFFCKSLECSAFVQSLLTRTMGKCPKCGRWFRVTKRGQIYDRKLCGTAHRVQRFRERKRGK